MSNGYFRLAKVDTSDGPLYIDQCWGGYAKDDGRSYCVGLDVSDGHAELYLSQDQVRALAAQIAEHFGGDLIARPDRDAA